MLLSEMQVGARVKLNRSVDAFNLGSFVVGSAGTVVSVNPNAHPAEPYAMVLMDDFFPELMEWGNQLEVSRYDAECSEITEREFDLMTFEEWAETVCRLVREGDYPRKPSDADLRQCYDWKLYPCEAADYCGQEPLDVA